MEHECSGQRFTWFIFGRGLGSRVTESDFYFREIPRAAVGYPTAWFLLPPFFQSIFQMRQHQRSFPQREATGFLAVPSPPCVGEEKSGGQEIDWKVSAVFVIGDRNGEMGRLIMTVLGQPCGVFPTRPEGPGSVSSL